MPTVTPSSNSKGIDIRQTGTSILFRQPLETSAGGMVTTGTTTLRIYEVQSDGTFKTYDFANNQFTAATPTTPSVSMNYQKSTNGTIDTGVWTYVLSVVTGFTVGAIYYSHVTNSGASPTDHLREWQYGSEEGDLVVVSTGAGTGDILSAPDWGHVQNPSTTVALANTSLGSCGGVLGDVTGKILGGGASTITGIGANVNSVQVGSQTVVVSVQAQGGTTTSLTLNSAEVGNPQGCQVSIVSGANAGLKGYCTAYNSSTNVANLTCLQTTTGVWPVPFDSTSYYTIDGLMPAVTPTGYVTSVGLRVERNTALNNFNFVMVLASDGRTGAPGKTVQPFRAIDSTTFQPCANPVTELGFGVYSINLASSDLNGSSITFRFIAPGCDDRIITVLTQSP